jgi:hypothetical protein
MCEDPGEQHKDVRFAGDSPLEESGFDLLVPLVDAGLFGRNGTKINESSRTI